MSAAARPVAFSIRDVSYGFPPSPPLGDEDDAPAAPLPPRAPPAVVLAAGLLDEACPSSTATLGGSGQSDGGGRSTGAASSFSGIDLPPSDADGGGTAPAALASSAVLAAATALAAAAATARCCCSYCCCCCCCAAAAAAAAALSAPVGCARSGGTYGSCFAALAAVEAAATLDLVAGVAPLCLSGDASRARCPRCADSILVAARTEERGVPFVLPLRGVGDFVAPVLGAGDLAEPAAEPLPNPFSRISGPGEPTSMGSGGSSAMPRSASAPARHRDAEPLLLVPRLLRSGPHEQISFGREGKEVAKNNERVPNTRSWCHLRICMHRCMVHAVDQHRKLNSPASRCVCGIASSLTHEITHADGGTVIAFTCTPTGETVFKAPRRLPSILQSVLKVGPIPIAGSLLLPTCLVVSSTRRDGRRIDGSMPPLLYEYM